MADCGLIETCAFHAEQVASGTGLGLLYGRSYCEKDWQHCARHRVAMLLGPANVPADLYPNMGNRADAIVAGRRQDSGEARSGAEPNNS